MRLVFVNHCHPNRPHVCGLRLGAFADALAAKGHEIVLLTETLARHDPAPSVIEFRRAMANHDWQNPYHLVCRPAPAPLLCAAREGGLPSGLRQTVLAWFYLAHGGVFIDWRRGSQPYWMALADTFQPQAVWGSFGNTDAWNIAQAIAHEARCPWVMDLKDPWFGFIPARLRARLARRYRDAAWMTTLSEGHVPEAELWFAQEKTVIYSGFPATVLDDPGRIEARDEINSDFRLMLTGSIYDSGDFLALTTGIQSWFASLTVNERGKVRFIYAGADRDRVAGMIDGIAQTCSVETHPYLSFEDLRRLQ